MINKVRMSFHYYRQRRRWRQLRKLGMHIGSGVNLPLKTWIDDSHCYLISIGDNCGFGEECVILAHDALPNEFINATMIGRVKIHESCHFGARTVILPGVEIGPRSIVGCNSVVVNDIPPETVAAGVPARVISTLDEYIAKHRKQLKEVPRYPYKAFALPYMTPERKRGLQNDLEKSVGYIIGGYTAMVEDGECLHRTK